ncbi:DNA repair protein RadA [Elongatibacter sediminis]|uniref:DNA repair protein RadA n=1 Tax=Elongatibacter sediminis TaxID=3119006 RepID=A0AAW9RJ59_9GAMM
MAKSRTAYQCETCGAMQPKWAGQCAECGAWNTLSETRTRPVAAARGGYAGADDLEPSRLADVGEGRLQRLQSGIGELDRVLGGGVVAGSVLLLGGDPGIGKSTLLLQMLSAVARQVPSLYVTGEESLQQVGMRARRLGLGLEELQCLAATDVDQVLAAADRIRPGLMIIDSIQTASCADLDSAPGSVSQVREATARLLRWAKRHGCCVILVGHVTKEGSLAGPRVLEHMVDAVLYFESDGSSRYRIIRAIKNRFGAVNELGMFAMTGTGLREVSNPSAIFLSGHEGPVSGSVVTVVREGTRPLLLELQALVATSHLNNPRRVSLGLDPNRLAMMLAVMDRHGGINLADQDVFVNVVGGIRINETSGDLPLILALQSSFRNRPLPSRWACFGEVGLSGEVRPVPDGQDRLKAAVGHGYEAVVVPASNAPRKPIEGLRVLPVTSVAQALDVISDDAAG